MANESVKVLYDRNCDPTKAYLLDLSKSPIPVFDERLAMVVHPDTPPEVVLAAKTALLGDRAISLLEQDLATVNALLDGWRRPEAAKVSNGE